MLFIINKNSVLAIIIAIFECTVKSEASNNGYFSNYIIMKLLILNIMNCLTKV